MESDNLKKINCFRCKHYANTWEPDFPRACRFFGFKAAQLPSVVVFNATGEPCVVFEDKEAHKQNDS